MQSRIGKLTPPIFGAFILVLGMAACESPDDSEADRDSMAAEHEGDRPEASPLTQPPEHPVDTMRVSYGELNGETLTGYMARPTNPDSFMQGEALPGVVLVHEWWGLNDNIRAMARRLAGQGYVTLAVDLYGDQVARQPDQARQYVEEALQNWDDIMANVRAAIGYLEGEGAEEVGILGWCFGGSVVMQSVVALDEQLDAGVVYYGRPITSRETLAALDTPVLAFFGATDQSIPLDSVRAMEDILQETSAESAVYVYDEAGHAFANPSGQNYMPEAATDSWEKTLSFLQEQLQ